MNITQSYTRNMLLLFAGMALFILYLVLYALIPRGAFEFSYFPSIAAPIFFTPMRGFTYEQWLGHLLRVFLAAPALLLLMFYLHPLVKQREVRKELFDRLAWLASIVSVGLIAWLVLFVFQGRAITLDELTYSVQAKILSEGQLVRMTTPYLIIEPFLIQNASGFTGKYLFGEPVMQIIGVWFGNPALMHIPLAALTLYFVQRNVWLATENKALASWSVILLALSPMFVFTTATGQSQATSLCCMALAGMGSQMVLRHGSTWGAWWLSVGIGWGMATRPQAAAPIGLVLIAAVLWCSVRKRMWRQGFVLLAGLSFFAGLICLYNTQVTGHPFRLPWNLFTPIEKYGLVQVWSNSSYVHTLWRGLINLFVVFVRWNAWWLGWPFSCLLLVGWFLVGRPKQGIRLWLGAAVAILVFEFGYYSTGASDTGPIYHYELLLPGAMLGAFVIVRGYAWKPVLVTTALAVHFFLGSGTFFAFQYARFNRLVETIHKDSDRVMSYLEKSKKPVLLFYERHCSEQKYMGWVDNSFPRRNYADSDKVVIYARPPQRWLSSYFLRYPNRDCWYYRRNPYTAAMELRRCREAKHLFTRPVFFAHRRCLWLPPMSYRRGFFHPWSEGIRWLPHRPAPQR